MKRTISMILCVSLLCAAFLLPASAALTEPEKPAPWLRPFYDLGDFVAKGLIGAITAAYPPPPGLSRAFNDSLLPPGTGAFITEPAGEKTWRLGYAKASLFEDYPGNIYDGRHYVMGSVDFVGKRRTADVMDDQMLRATAMSDGSGRGTAVFISVDAYGLTSADIGKIRRAALALEGMGDVVSLNVSSLHQHSVIDTLGMGGNLLAALFANPLAMYTGWYTPSSGKDPAFMAHLTQVAAQTAQRAVGNMTSGKITYSKADVSDFILDRRTPVRFEPDIHRLRFIPDDGSAETWLCNMGLHPVGTGLAPCVVTGDYPAYIEKAINEARGANFQMIQSAIMAIDPLYDPPALPEAQRFLELERVGRTIAQRLLDLPESAETPVEPILNIAHRNYVLPIDNPLHLLMFRLGILEANGRKKNLWGTKVELCTEVGYVEFGKSLAAAMVPGEIDGSLAFGGQLTKEQAWNGWVWEFTPLRDMLPAERKMMVFGLTNDMTGYMIQPNDISNFIVFENEEINMAGKEAATRVLEAFRALLEDSLP